jgi:hypothetical protein
MSAFRSGSGIDLWTDSRLLEDEGVNTPAIEVVGGEGLELV